MSTPIPTNPESLNVSEETTRFQSAVWFENMQKKIVALAGLGGIGSYVCYALARMKPSAIILYDDDVVETVNMSGQMYSVKDIGNYKTGAIAEKVQMYSNYYNIISYSSRFTESSEPSKIMICGFDNMEARKVYFNAWLKEVHSLSEEDKKLCLFIDGRLAAEEFQILCIRGDDNYNIERYKNEFLFTDEEADSTICSYKQTTYCAMMIGSIIVNLLVNFVAIESSETAIMRDLPFFTSYNAELMYFKTEK